MWNVVGHDWAVERLSSAIRYQRVGHAYLITGPEQVGRTTLATVFAQALNCTSEFLENRPCGTCRSCALIRKGRHPDLRLLEPEVNARGKGVIKIEQIRELQKDLNLAAVEGPYKIAILSDFNAANPAAGNAFLKTLEEPPPKVILILTATEADSLLPTINSRCRTVNLRPVKTSLIATHLMDAFELQPDRAKLLAHIANGRIGWAIEAAQDEEILETHQTRIGDLITILRAQRVARFKTAEKLAKAPEMLSPLLQTWMSWWRDGMQMAWGMQAEAGLINIDQVEKLNEMVKDVDPQAVKGGLRQTEEALIQLSQNGNVRLVLENLFLKYPYLNLSE